MNHEMAVALICPLGHREATLKSHYSTFGQGSVCSRCGKMLAIEREALVRVRPVRGNEMRSRHRRLTYQGPPSGVCDVCARPLSEHHPYNRHPR